MTDYQIIDKNPSELKQICIFAFMGNRKRIMIKFFAVAATKVL